MGEGAEVSLVLQLGLYVCWGRGLTHVKPCVKQVRASEAGCLPEGWADGWVSASPSKEPLATGRWAFSPEHQCWSGQQEAGSPSVTLGARKASTLDCQVSELPCGHHSLRELSSSNAIFLGGQPMKSQDLSMGQQYYGG